MSTPVFEVAVYSVKEEMVEKFLQHQPTAHTIIRQFKGFTSLRSLRSTESPNTFIDYCEWESLEDAKNANTAAMAHPDLQMFFELGDGVITFGHYYSMRETSSAAPKKTSAGDVPAMSE